MNAILFLCAAVSQCSSNTTSALPDDIVQIVHQQVLIDFHNITGAHINGISVHIPQAHVDEGALQSIQHLQSTRESALHEVQSQVVSAQEKQESLNRRLRSGQYTDEFLVDYAGTSGNQTGEVVQSVSTAMKPYTTVLRHAIANFVLSPYLRSVTSGSELFNQGLHRSGETDDESREVAHTMTTNYGELAHLGMLASLDYAELQTNTEQIISLLKL